MRLRPDDPPAPTLALVAAVALHEAVSLYVQRVVIKWPNDLLAGKAKLAGILLEREGEAVIAGFGVNLAHEPLELDRPATSLAALSGSAPDAGEFAERLSAAFSRWLGRWRMDGFAPVRFRWLEAAHPVGTRLSIQTACGEHVDGSFDGLDEGGALRLRLPDGTIRLHHAGDVFLL